MSDRIHTNIEVIKAIIALGKDGKIICVHGNGQTTSIDGKDIYDISSTDVDESNKEIAVNRYDFIEQFLEVCNEDGDIIEALTVEMSNKFAIIENKIYLEDDIIFYD